MARALYKGNLQRASIVLILLLAAFVRFHALAQDLRFQSDEALFATFARNAALNGDWLFHGALDKPPLILYAMAVSMSFAARGSLDTLLDFDARQGEFAARVPNTFASLVLVAVMYAWVKRLSSNRTVALIAALLTACSPLLAAFSASAFTDILMLLGVTAALWMSAAKRPLWAGVWLALGFFSKQQALYYVPLVILMLVVTRKNEAPSYHYIRRMAAQAVVLLFPLIIAIALLLVWDSARAEPTGLLALAAANNAPNGLAALADIPARINLWLAYGSHLLGTPPITAVLMLMAFAAFVARPTRLDALLWGFIALYSLVHWVVAFNIYDRYLLVVLPLYVVLAARGIGWSMKFRAWRALQANKPLRMALILVFALLLLGGAWHASEGNIIGERTDDTILDLATFLNSQTLGAIIYDRWLGWELDYYLGQWTEKRKVYYPTPQMLVEDALLQLDPAPRYFVAPLERPYQAWINALATAGFGVSLVYDTPPYLVFRLIPPPR
jgi:4-amino-4-deoxy-L-arabinose transferase-like glycosyltransferase